jgi:prolyl 4-hydroxylase
MILEIHGGLGDEVAATAAVREYKRQNPDEIVTIFQPERPAIWKHNPHLGWGKYEGGRSATLRMDKGRSNHGGNAAHAHAAQLGIQLADDTPELWLTSAERAAAAGLWETFGFDPARTACIDIGAGWESKRWPASRWTATVAALSANGWKVVELGTRTPGNGHLAAGLPGVAASFLDATSIREAAALIASSALFLGHDSGLMHVAAAVGTPSVIVFGSTKWYEYAYYNSLPVFPATSCGEHCYKACYRPPKNERGQFSHCMTEIGVERVVAAVELAARRFPFPAGGRAPRNPRRRPASARHPSDALRVLRGSPVNVVPLSLDPRMFLLEGALSREDCAAIIDAGRDRLTAATVFTPDFSGRKARLEEARTGKTSFLHREHPAIKRLVYFVRLFSGQRIEQLEAVQVAYYGVGDEYGHHIDSFLPGHAALDPAEGGQRIWSALAYLNDVGQGGETEFPRLGVRLLPVAGNVVIWENVDAAGEVDPRALHAALAPVSGPKWSAALWVREGVARGA